MSTTAKTVTMKGSPQNKSPATIGTKNQNPTLVQEAKSRITPPLNVDHIITSNRAAEYVFKYIIIGDAGVGKSSLMQQFVNGTFSLNNASTVGVEFGTKNIRIGDNIISLQIWDTAGQERFRSVTRQYYRGAACALLVYDTAKRSTFASVLNWLTDARNYTGPNTIIFLVGNKVDLADQRQVSFEEASKLAKDYNIAYIEASAKTNANVNEIFIEAAKKILKNIETGVIDQSDKNSGVEFPLSIESDPIPNDNKCAC